MHLYDPLRPKIGDRLAYCRPDGKPTGTIPPWVVYPRPDGYVYLSIYLMTQPNNASQYEFRFAPADFLMLYLEWLDGPEEWYVKHLGWKWEDAAPAITKTPTHRTPAARLSLADIGL